ncbi:MAG: hypothetical protein IT440_10275 [Phycisphaeraceae bacterium]|nr:hypothetical protein [Phycisphaeraceae bacterium]
MTRGTPTGAWTPPERGLDIQDSTVAVDLLTRAAEANLRCPLRQGSVVHLPGTGHVLIAGDLHDHLINYQRLLLLACLHQSSESHLILQELIHGSQRLAGCDMSIRMLVRVAALKLAYPRQVHLLQSNHELSQLNGDGILKDGVSLVDAFEDGIDYIYGDEADEVRDAMRQFIRSFPLAVRGPQGVFCAHSLPSARQMDGFDAQVFLRTPTDDDLRNGGSAYRLVWGRQHSQSLLEQFGQLVNADLFVVGHQPADMGYDLAGDRMIILASDHDHGMALPLDLGQRYTQQDFVDRLIPLAGIPVCSSP